MNLYILVEGRRTESRVYPKWIKYLLPRYSRILSPDAIAKNCYYLISGEGFPRLLDVALPHSIEDINNCGQYAYFVICLDADDVSVEERRAEVQNRFDGASPQLDSSVTVRIIVQNRSIETWFLGNRAVFPKKPTGKRFREFVQFYNVLENDPEEMGVMDGYATHAGFHHDYLREMFRERGIAYTKYNPGHVSDESYLNQLISRVQDCGEHLRTFQSFHALCCNIRELTANTV